MGPRGHDPDGGENAAALFSGYTQTLAIVAVGASRSVDEPKACDVATRSSSAKCSAIVATSASASLNVEHHPKDALQTPVATPPSSTSTPSPHTLPAA